jgi:hypothetical protein
MLSFFEVAELEVIDKLRVWGGAWNHLQVTK